MKPTNHSRPSNKPFFLVWDWPIIQPQLWSIFRALLTTFKTLKTDGYHFEHNFGHGHHYLASVLAYLCMLAFLLDQVVGHSCGLFQQALQKHQRKLYLRDAMVRLFKTFLISSWETFCRALYEPRKMLEVEAVLKDP